MESQKEAILWGAIAGGATLLAEALALDPASLFKNFDGAIFLGYCVKGGLLMGLGALIVRLNKETDIQKAFQLGIMAPALIIGAQSGIHLNKANQDLSDVQNQLESVLSNQPLPENARLLERDGGSGFFIRQAYAQAVVAKGELREVKALPRFWYGLTGSASNSWFVVVTTYNNKAQAGNHAAKLRAEGWSAEVGDGPTWNNFYPVLIGKNLSKERADLIRQLAVKEGLPRSTHIRKR